MQLPTIATKSLKLALLPLFLIQASSAHATVWWPEVKPVSASLTVYKDYQDSNLYYFIPKQARISTTDADVKMINHGLFFNRLKPSDSITQYNMTLEPQLSGKEIDEAQVELKKLYGPAARLVPLPITTTSFEVTEQKAGAPGTIAAPFAVILPNWTGDMHSFQQRFSVVMRANAYMAEPAMSEFVSHPAGNALVGTMHFGFRGIQVPFEGHAKINVHQFLSKMKASLSVGNFWARGSIGYAADKLKDDRDVFIEVVKDAGYESEVWKSILDKAISLMFEPVPQVPNAPSGGGGFGFFRMNASYASSQLDRVITINLKEAIIKEHSGDLDIAGGGVPESLLNKNIKYMCHMWAKYDSPTGACKDVCEPVNELYNPATKSCQAAWGLPVL